ncbi:DUF1992 domain-containing protein [Rahnella inusitata]|uniref:DnaJ family domain-containing protein n=1 Tax=Rahnella inusitata TaxID=58169 RepID=UPI0039AEC59B
MFLIDQWVEKHIKDASENGEFDNLAGQGKPLVLDDDSAVPEELRTAYRILKNSGYLPPELQDRKEAIELNHMLRSLMPDNPEFCAIDKRLNVLKLRLQQAGISTDFLEGPYRDELNKKFKGV